MVSTTLPVPVLLGEDIDVPELKQLLGNAEKKQCTGTGNVMVVVTRAQAKKQLQEEIIRRENEVLSGAYTSPVKGLGEPEPSGHTIRGYGTFFSCTGTEMVR